jgi:hypothetical protein
MKTALIIYALVLACFGAKAQSIGSGTAVTGTTNVPLWFINGNYYGPVTNTFQFQVGTKFFSASGITSTNEVQIMSYGFYVAGTTNYIPVNYLTNSFLGGTNNGSFGTNIAQQPVFANLVPAAQISIGNFTNTVGLNP